VLGAAALAGARSLRERPTPSVALPAEPADRALNGIPGETPS
jgi:hypothetical protein